MGEASIYALLAEEHPLFRQTDAETMTDKK